MIASVELCQTGCAKDLESLMLKFPEFNIYSFSLFFFVFIDEVDLNKIF